MHANAPTKVSPAPVVSTGSMASEGASKTAAIRSHGQRSARSRGHHAGEVALALARSPAAASKSVGCSPSATAASIASCSLASEIVARVQQGRGSFRPSILPAPAPDSRPRCPMPPSSLRAATRDPGMAPPSATRGRYRRRDQPATRRHWRPCWRLLATVMAFSPLCIDRDEGAPRRLIRTLLDKTRHRHLGPRGLPRAPRRTRLS